jgi:predicted homoserine dehydrogenase-like protein
LKAGEILDGEGGFTVYGHLVPAHRSKAQKLLPIGLAHGIRVLRDVPAGVTLSEDDVEIDATRLSVKIRREMCLHFSKK